MRAVVLRSLLVIGVGGLVLAGVLYVASTVDARPPEVLEVRLTQAVADDPDRGFITTSIEVLFSEPVEADAADAISIDPPVDGSASWSGSTLIFTPLQPLELDTEYRVSIGPGIRDPAGNEMAELPDPYTFATTGRPALASSEPADGDEEVAVDTVIALAFSTLMDTASVESALELEPAIQHDLRWSGQRLEIVPQEPLEPASDYTVTLGGEAADIAGVAIGDAVSIGFRTVAPGLGVDVLVPADRTDGIAPRTPIAVILDRPVDADSLDPDLLEISPPVGGTLGVATLPGDPDAAGRVLRFTASAPLPSNTTFELILHPGLQSEAGGELAEEVRWSFTTGAPQPALSNQVLFLSDRGGVTNVWAMNPDGTGQRQVSAELTPVLDYATAPNGSSIVVGDGRRLVFLQADGSNRQVLTDEAHLEFDPAYAPDGSEVTFARADASSGAGLGLWTWELGSGAVNAVELPPDLRPDATPASPDRDDEPGRLRAPRYAPDGQALAYVDLDGHLGILELPAERHTRMEGEIVSAPVWSPDSSGVYVTLGDGGSIRPVPFSAPVAPLVAADPAGVGLGRRSGTRLDDAGLGDGARLGGVAAEGRIAYVDAGGRATIADADGAPGSTPEGLESTRVDEIRFGPGEATVIIVTGRPEGSGRGGIIERVDVESGERTRLVRDGWHVRWLP